MSFESFEDEIRRLMRRIYKRIWEIRREIEETQEDLFSRVLHAIPSGPVEPLHSIYEFPDEYVAVIDIPKADSSSLTVLVGEDYIEVKARISIRERIESPFYARLSKEQAAYVKRLMLPLDADVSSITYRLERGRLIVNIPKKRVTWR